ncbi:hypothetical protein MC885_018421 [Smutsia gigantea]|nr:hypothetical protein MC885_018421 [Smutsia gigantea]
MPRARWQEGRQMTRESRDCCPRGRPPPTDLAVGRPRPGRVPRATSEPRWVGGTAPHSSWLLAHASGSESQSPESP